MVADILKEKMDLREKRDFIATRKGVLNPNTLSKEERIQLIKEKTGVRKYYLPMRDDHGR